MFGRSKSTGSRSVRASRGNAPVAIDFGRSSTRLLQLNHANGTAYGCRAAAEIPGAALPGGSGPLASDADLGSRMRQVLEGLGFVRGLATVTVPAEAFQSDIARMPQMTDAELAESVRFEALDRFGIRPEDSSIGHVRLGGTAGGTQEVLMLALSRTVVQRASAIASSAGLGLVRIEHAALAALRAIGRQRASECADPTDAQDFAMLHLEDRVATLVVVREGNLSFMRSIAGDWAPAGMTSVRRTGTGRGTSLRLADDEIPVGNESGPCDSSGWRWCSLAEESLRCLRHFQRTSGGWWPRAIAITGPAAMDPQAAATIESVCGAPCALSVPIRMIDAPEPCIQGNAWIAAIGGSCASLSALARSPREELAAEPLREPTRAGRTTTRTGTIALEPEPKPIAAGEGAAA